MTSISLRNQIIPQTIPFKAKSNKNNIQTQQTPQDKYTSNAESKYKFVKAMIRTSEYTAGAISGTIRGGMVGAGVYFGIEGLKKLNMANNFIKQHKNPLATVAAAGTFVVAMLKSHINATERIALLDNKRK